MSGEVLVHDHLHVLFDVSLCMWPMRHTDNLPTISCPYQRNVKNGNPILLDCYLYNNYAYACIM